MTKRIRLWVECDDLKPDGLLAILANEDDTDDDVLIEAADHHRSRNAAFREH